MNLIRNRPVAFAGAVQTTLAAILTLSGVSTITQGIVLGASAAWLAVFGQALSVPTTKANEQAADARVAGADEREVRIGQYLAAKPPAKARAVKKA